jgi:hypothetical protein
VRRFFLLLSLLFLSGAGINYPPADLWKGILGETSDYQVMLRIACCVRNRYARGMNHGLIAMQRKDLDRFVLRYCSEKDRIKARRAVRAVFVDNIDDMTNGSDHLEYTVKYGNPSWVNEVVVVHRYKGWTFYRRRRK